MRITADKHREGGIMGPEIEDWVHDHAFGVLLGVEILWVSGFLAVFVLYFLLKRWVKKQPKPTDDARGPHE